MSKIKFVFLNSIGMIVAGSIIVSFMIEFVWMVVSGETSIPVERLAFNFVVGLFISTTLVLLQLLLMKFNKQMAVGYFIGAVIIAAVLVLIYVYTGLTTGIWGIDSKWLVIFVVVETFSLGLLAYWYRQISLYNQKLDKKKAALSMGNRQAS